MVPSNRVITTIVVVITLIQMFAPVKGEGMDAYEIGTFIKRLHK